MTATGYVSTTGDTRKVNKSGDTLTGDLVLNDATPDTANSAAARAYVDALVALLAPLAGAAFTGPVTVTGANVTVVDGQLVLDSSGTAINAVDRGTTSSFAAYVLRTAGVDRWAWQMVNDATNDLVLTDSANGVEVLRVTPGANPNLKFIGDFLLQGTGKAYRFRRSGSNLDFEGTGVDLIFSNWSGTAFNGSQRSYMRLSADAQNIQVAGKVEFVDVLYGAAKHTLDGAANKVGFYGATPTAKPTVTGSRGGNAALASLLSALATLGLITDGTSA